MSDEWPIPEEVLAAFDGPWPASRRPPSNLSARQLWEQAKAERGWEQLPTETVREMDARLGTGLSGPRRWTGPSSSG